MYDDLVMRLRRYVEIERSEHHGAELEAEAADAIEELSMKLHGDEAAIAGMKREIERMVVARKPCWISVKERLPEDGVDVICWIRNDEGDCYACGGWYDTTFKMWDLDSEYARSRHVTHWMPLPEPPKEEV